MKKLSKILLVTMIVFSLVGCGEKASAVEQEQVVTHFFNYIKAGDVEKANKLGTDEYENYFSNALDSLNPYLDESAYGKVFVNEAQKFISVVFENLIKEYKIKSSKVEGDKTTIAVTGRFLELETMNVDDMTKATKELTEAYHKEHTEELKKIYAEKNQDGVMEKIFADIGKDLFALFVEKIEAEKGTEFTLSFELLKENDKWLINKIANYEKPSSKDTDYLDVKKEEEENTETDFKVYKVDQSKLKDSATLLKKGKLFGEDYLSQKYVNTDLEFIDYNVSSDTDEIDKYDTIDTSNGILKFETEIHGHKGSTVVILIKDDDQTLAIDEYTLTDVKQVFTKNITKVDTDSKYFSVTIYVGKTFNKEYEIGEEVGSYLISKDV